jgi:hypothetical protein
MANPIDTGAPPAFRTAVVVISLVALALVAACANALKERSAMDSMTGTSTTRRAAIPPIDASVPVHTETATFALG